MFINIPYVLIKKFLIELLPYKWQYSGKLKTQNHIKVQLQRILTVFTFVNICIKYKKVDETNSSTYFFILQYILNHHFFKKSGISMFVKLGETSGIEVLLG